MDWTPVINQINELLVTLMTSLIAVAGAFAISYLNKLKDKAVEQTNGIKDENSKKLAQDAIDRINTLVFTTVTYIQQELVGEIKKSIQDDDGVFTKEDLYKLKDRAIEIVQSQIQPSVAEAAKSQIADLNGYIANLVSQYVYQLKQTEIKSSNAEAITGGVLNSDQSDDNSDLSDSPSEEYISSAVG